MTDFYEIQELVKLFNPPRENDDSDDDNENNISVNTTSVKTNNEPPNEEKTKPNPYAKIEDTGRLKPEDIELYNEDNLSSESKPSTDWKKTPSWNINYRQKVTASDVFLQMSAKNPSTASCEDMIVTIDLPGEHMQNMDIKVCEKNLEVYSPNYALNLPLPQPVHPQKGNAKWDKDNEQLTITLTMDREFDFINF